MRFLNDISIRLKVLTAPLILVISLIIVSFLSIYALKEQRDTLKAVNDIALEKITLVDQYITLSELVQSDVFLISMLRSMDLPMVEIQPVQGRLAQGLSDLNIIYGQILTRWQLDSTERHTLERMKAPMDAFRFQAEQAASVVMDNPSLGVILVRSSTAPFADFRRTLSEFLNYQKVKIVRMSELSDQEAWRISAIIIAIVLLIGLTATLATILFSTRLISDPIRSITNLMHRLAEGDLSIRVAGQQHRDEIGAMARAVEVFRRNAMEKSQLDKELRQSEERYRLLFHHTPAGVFHYNSQLRITECNERMAAILQSTKERILGLDMNTLKDQSVMPALRQALSGQDGFYEGQYRATTGTGQPWVILHTAPLLDREGEFQGCIGLIEDITARKQAEEEKERLQKQLAQAQKMKSIGILAGGIAHEFNNLLQVILGYNSLLLLDKTENDKEYPSLLAIQNSCRRGVNLVKQLLLYSRKAEFLRRPIDLNQEVEQARQVFERTIPKMVDIKVNPGRRLWTVLADPGQVQHVLLNLGSNAADAMPHGGTLYIQTENITLGDDYPNPPSNRGWGAEILGETRSWTDFGPQAYSPYVEEPKSGNERCSQELRASLPVSGESGDYVHNHLGAIPGNYVLLTVSDTGHGMDKETAQHIFDPFFTTKEVGKGTGLGLASVYGIIKSHDGYITCDSELGQGTTFRIYLPILALKDPPADKLPERPSLTGGTETILLADDDAAIRDFAARVLRRFGYTVITATNGEEALEIFLTQKSKIDLVLLDIGMPGMGDHRCLREILQIDPAAKVVIACGYSADGRANSAVEAGAAGYVGKPYQLADLLNKVRAVLDRKE